MNGIDVDELSAKQMTDVSYALLIRDTASSVDRSRIDDILAGRITVQGEMAPGLDSFDPNVDEATLRENWGRGTAAIQGQEAMRDFISQVEPGGKMKGTGSE